LGDTRVPLTTAVRLAKWEQFPKISQLDRFNEQQPKLETLTFLGTLRSLNPKKSGLFLETSTHLNWTQKQQFNSHIDED